MPIRKTTISELKGLFSTLGVHEGDTVMVHSALFTLGRIEGGIEGLYCAVRSVLGDTGTLVVPTFTYSFRRNQVFDVRKTPSSGNIGAFAEQIRQKPEAVRSTDPMFSMAAVGPAAETLMERTSHNSFGKGSIYEKLFRANTLFLALGITYSTGIACFMHLERLAEVDYRIEMRFDGISIGYDGTEYDDWAMHFARNETKYSFARQDRDFLGRRMEEAGISQTADLGSGHHIALRAEPFKEYVLEAIARDPFIMLNSDFKNQSSWDVPPDAK